MRTSSFLMIFFACLLAGIILTLGPQRPPAHRSFAIPDSCLIIGDTLRVVDYRELLPGEDEPWVGFPPFEEDGMNVWTWGVGGRRILLQHQSGVKVPQLYIIGVSVGETEVPARNIFSYVRVREDCEDARARILAELEDDPPGRRIFWAK